jgi:hypothetical protein
LLEHWPPGLINHTALSTAVREFKDECAPDGADPQDWSDAVARNIRLALAHVRRLKRLPRARLHRFTKHLLEGERRCVLAAVDLVDTEARTDSGGAASAVAKADANAQDSGEAGDPAAAAASSSVAQSASEAASGAASGEASGVATGGAPDAQTPADDLPDFHVFRSPKRSKTPAVVLNPGSLCMFMDALSATKCLTGNPIETRESGAAGAKRTGRTTPMKRPAGASGPMADNQPLRNYRLMAYKSGAIAINETGPHGRQVMQVAGVRGTACALADAAIAKLRSGCTIEATKAYLIEATAAARAQSAALAQDDE